MLKQLKYLFLLGLLVCGTLCHAEVFHTEDKVYIDADAFKANTKGDEFYIHVGNNVWLVTHTINRDATGMFAYEASLSKSVTGPDYKMDYEKKWKCPYCYNYWPIGKPCGNKDCPSKYK